MAIQGKLLIADDDTAFRESTAELLHQVGYECDCAASGSVVLDMLAQTPYDLVIADIRMPGNGDLELVRKLAKGPDIIPVILVTGYPSIMSAVPAVELPVAAYLIKPVDFKELHGHIKASLRNAKLLRSMRRAKERLQGWSKDMTKVEDSFEFGGGGDPACAATYLQLTFQNINNALLDVMHLAEDAFEVRAPGQQGICHLLNCPRLTASTDKIRKTVDVLEQTKTAFKSKQLADLRQELETFLKASRLDSE